MSNIKQAIQQLKEPIKSIGNILIEFYETMKALETDQHKGGKQATKIVMTLNDIENVIIDHFLNTVYKQKKTSHND